MVNHTVSLFEQKKAVLNAAQVIKQAVAKLPARPERTKPNEVMDYLRAHSTAILRGLEAAMSTLDALDHGRDMRPDAG